MDAACSSDTAETFSASELTAFETFCTASTEVNMRALPSFFLTWLFSIPFCLYYARSEGQGRSPSGGFKLGIDSAPLSTKDLNRARHYVFRKR